MSTWPDWTPFWNSDQRNSLAVFGVHLATAVMVEHAFMTPNAFLMITIVYGFGTAITIGGSGVGGVYVALFTLFIALFASDPAPPRHAW